MAEEGARGACEGEGCTRRRAMAGFLGAGALATGASVGYPLVSFLVPPQVAEAAAASVVVEKAASLPPNGWAKFKMGSRPGLLLRLPGGEFRAFSAVCTHLSCTVQYRPEERRIWCACHNGFYDTSGKNVSGPPPRPLEEFAAHVLGEDVVVSRNA